MNDPSTYRQQGHARRGAARNKSSSQARFLNKRSDVYASIAWVSESVVRALRAVGDSDRLGLEAVCAAESGAR